MGREPNISIGVDIGNTKVTTCVGKFEDGNIDILGMGFAVNQGMRKGVIIDTEETVSAITASLQEAEKTSGFNIDNATIGISGPFIESEISRGVIAVSRPDGEITEEDVARAIEAARAIPSKPNREILHVLPINFIIDGNETIKDPVGMVGIRLEVNANIISASSNGTKSFLRAVEQAGIAVNDLVFSPLATAKVLLSKRQIEIGAMLIDIGSSTTSYAVYEEGELITCGVVPVGSMHITNDIAIALRTNLDVADTIKTHHAFAMADKVDGKTEIDLSKISKLEEGSANFKYIAEIVEARLNEIFALVKDNLTRAGVDTALPAGVILTGGGSKLDGIVEMAKECLRLPVKIGEPEIEISGLIDKLNNPIYSTSIGLMLWGKDKTSPRRPAGIDIPGMGDFVGKIKSVFKNILP